MEFSFAVAHRSIADLLPSVCSPGPPNHRIYRFSVPLDTHKAKSETVELEAKRAVSEPWTGQKHAGMHKHEVNIVGCK